MRERRKTLVPAAAAAALAPLIVSAAACGGIEAGEGRPVSGAVPGPPQRIVRGTLQPHLLLTGELEAARGQAVTVPRSPIRQVQIRWMEEDGARVRRGDPVIELDNDQVAQEIEEKRLAVTQQLEAFNQARADAELALAEAEFALVRAEAELEKAELAAAIPEGLLAAREVQERQLELARSRVAVDKARRDLETSRRTGSADVEVAAVALARARRDVEVSEQALDQLSLEAPGDGIFLVGNHPWEQRPFQPGDNVWVGFPLAQIPDLSTMVVKADLPDVDDGRVAVGSPVRCVLDAYPEREIGGRIEEIAEVAKQPGSDSLRRFFAVRIGLDEGDPERLRPGMSVKVEVLAEPGEEGLLVPRWAIDWSADPLAVRLAAGGLHPIAVTACDLHRCAIAGGDGLEPGTRVAPAGESG